MDEETTSEVVEQTPSAPETPAQAEPSQASADLSAGFNKVRGIEPPAEVDQEPGPSADELRDVVAKMPEIEQIKGQSADELRKIHGKIGELNQRLQALAAAPTAANSEAAKAARQKLTDEYPELAETILPLMSGGVSQDQVAQAVKEQISAAVAESNQKIEQLQAQVRLTRAHPDWEEVPQSAAYQAWLPTLQPTVREELLNSWDANLVSKRLSEFKEWKTNVFTKRQTQQAKLAAAIPPSGVPGRANSKVPDSAGLAAGFNRVRRPLGRVTL
jgi:outer membrane murein-binding lipoprotein Lpp